MFFSYVFFSSSAAFSVAAADFRTFSEHCNFLSPATSTTCCAYMVRRGCRLWHTFQKSWFLRGVGEARGGSFTLLFRTASAETTKPWLFGRMIFLFGSSSDCATKYIVSFQVFFELELRDFLLPFRDSCIALSASVLYGPSPQYRPSPHLFSRATV